MHPEAEAWVRAALAGSPGRLVRVTAPDPPIELRVPGAHNRRNAACVWTICRTIGLSDAVIRAALRGFAGLPHRLEFVATVDGVHYINDSKSTAPTATVIAINALTDPDRSAPRAENVPAAAAVAAGAQRDVLPAGGRSRGGAARRGSGRRAILVIVGGQRKEVPLDECAALLARTCGVVICYGQAGPAFAQAVRSAGDADPPSVVEVRDMPEAVRTARAEACAGDTVLLSPGAPSFDQYVNFTERGRHFAELVGSL